MHVLQFRITGDSLVPEDLASLFNMRPKISYVEGDDIRSSLLIWEHGIDTTHYQGNWLPDIKVSDNQSIEKAIEEFIVLFSPFSSKIKELVNSNEYKITLWLTVYPEVMQMYFCVSPFVISKLFDMGITFGVSIMSQYRT